jgi:hypothetical protein
MKNEFYTSAASIGAEFQEKAKSAYEKGSALFGEFGNITKGNIAATAESGKILGNGLQQLGAGYVADSRAVIDTLLAEVKELATAKSPIDFFKLQGEFARRSFETLVELGSKNTDAFLQLAQEVSTPLAERAKTVVDAVRTAA